MKYFYSHPTFYVLFSLFLLFSCSNKKPKVVGKQALLKEKIFIGDSLFKAGNYITASEYYKKALIIQPNNQYVTKKLKEIDVKTGVAVATKKDTPKTKVAGAKQKGNVKATKIATTTKPKNKTIKKNNKQVITKTKPVKKKRTPIVAKSKPIAKKNHSTSVVYNNSNKKTDFFKNPYHVIVGSFRIRDNAIKLANKFKNKGYNAVQISRFNGKFTAVSILSLNNIHTAYNNMRDVRNEFGINDAWVLYQKSNSTVANNSYSKNNYYSKNTNAKESYNVVIGSFKIKRNADLLTDKYKNKGYDAIQIPRFNGKFTAVAIAFANTYQAARKNMNNIKNNLGIDAWILQQ